MECVVTSVFMLGFVEVGLLSRWVCGVGLGAFLSARLRGLRGKEECEMLCVDEKS